MPSHPYTSFWATLLGPYLHKVVVEPAPSPSEGDVSGPFYNMAWWKWQDMPKAVQMAHVLGEIIPVLSGSNIAEQPIWCAGQNFDPEK